MKKFLEKTNLEILVMIFIIMQPIIDIYRTFFQDTLNVFGFAIEELIIMLFVGAMLILTVCKIIITEKRFKSLIKYIIYFAFFAVYLVLHYLNMKNFNIQVYEQTDFNFIIESYYMVRTYILPILMIYVVYNSYITNKNFAKTVLIVCWILAGIIFISNLFGVSFIAYSADKEMIKGNIFEWFKFDKNVEYYKYTSRGYFQSANQISALILSLFPIAVGEAIKKLKVHNFVLIFVQMIAMIMIGTKTAALGGLLIIGAMLVASLILSIFKIEKIKGILISSIALSLILLIGFGVYSYSPAKLKYSEEKQAQQVSRPDPEVKVDSAENELTFEEYVNQHAYDYFIKDWFLELYPVHNDEAFWRNVITRDKLLNMNNRNFKVEMIGRIIERNDNKLDSILGIGYTSNVPYTERDFAYQYFVFGIAGMILLMGPFIFVSLYAIFRMIKDYKTKLTIQNGAILASLICLMGAGYLAGHVFGIVLNMYFMSFYAGKLLINMKKDEEE